MIMYQKWISKAAQIQQDADKDKQEQVKKIWNVKAGIKRIQDRLFAIEPDQVIRI